MINIHILLTPSIADNFKTERVAPSAPIKYASASETERDIPAEQCTSVLPPAARAALMKSLTLGKWRCRSVDSTSGTAMRRYVQR